MSWNIMDVGRQILEEARTKADARVAEFFVGRQVTTEWAGGGTGNGIIVDAWIENNHSDWDDPIESPVRFKVDWIGNKYATTVWIEQVEFA